jgi:parallel beta-helix repeat protein
MKKVIFGFLTVLIAATAIIAATTTNFNWNLGTKGQYGWWDVWAAVFQNIDTEVYGIKHGTTVLDDIKTKSPWVDIRSFMDGQSGRPTYAQWYANQATILTDAVWTAALASGYWIIGPPNSTFFISTPLILSSNQIIDLNGSTLTTNTASTDLIQATGIVGSLLQNITIKRINFINTGSANSNGVNLTYVNNSLIEDCIFQTCSDGVKETYCTYPKVVKNYFTGCGAGIANYYTTNAVIKTNIILDSSTYGIFHEFNSYNGSIEGNKIITVTGGYGICLDNAPDGTQVINNEVSQTNNTAITLNNTQDLVVSCNRVHDTTITAIDIATVINSVISNNVLTNIGSTTSHHGILLELSSNGNSVVGNSITNAAGESIYLTSGTNNVVSGNQLKGAFLGIAATATLGGYNTITSNQITMGFGSGNNNAIYQQNETTVGDGVWSTPDIVLSDAAASYSFHANHNLAILWVQFVYSVGSSGDAGIVINCGKTSSAAYYVAYTTEINKAQWYTKSYANNTMANLDGSLDLGDNFVVSTAGGKVGVGTVKVYIGYSYF